MAVVAEKQNNPYENLRVDLLSPRRALLSSVIMHGIIVAIIIIGLPYFKPELPPLQQVVMLELADISDVTQTNRAPSNAKKKPSETKDEQTAQSNKPRVAPRVTAHNPPKLSAPEEPDLTVPKKEPAPLKAPPPIKKPQKVEKKPKIETKTTKEVAEEQEEFDSVLKNLMSEEETAQQSEEDKKGTTGPSPDALLGQTMTVTEVGYLNRQISKCWNLMAGARYAEDLVVELRLYMTRDGMVRKAEVLDRFRYNGDSFFRAAADAALRAVRSPSCTPFDLPLEKYDQWKIIDVTFDPRNML